MNRTYHCKGCGREWKSEGRYSDYFQECPECGRRTAPDKLPRIIHYTVRGLEPRGALCNPEIHDGLDNFSLKRTTCKECLRILSKGEGLYNKCIYCANFTRAINRPDWTVCVADPLPEEVVFEITNHLTMDAVGKGCRSRFRFSKKWEKFLQKARKLKTYHLTRK